MPQVTSQTLVKATEYTCREWFPCKDSSIRELDIFFDNKNSEISVTEIFNLIREDASLYIRFLAEFSDFYVGGHPQSKKDGNIFSTITPEQLRTAYSKVKKLKSRHSYSSLTDFQKIRLNEMIVAATATSYIGKNKNINADFTFSSALLRQLGHTLIAWNYPQIYANVTSSSKTLTVLENDLRKSLGFTPSMLGYAVTDKLGLSKYFGDVLPTEGNVYRSNFKSKPKNNLQSQVSKICEIGEALARSINPNLYITSSADYQSAVKKLTTSLGPNSLEEINSLLTFEINITQEKKVGFLEESNYVLPHLAELDTLGEEVGLNREELLRLNGYVDVLPSQLYNEVAVLYSAINEDSDLRLNTKTFVKKILPKTYFSSTKIYLLDSIERKIHAAFISGKAESKIVKPNTFSLTGLDNFFGSAISLNTPIREVVNTEDGKSLSIIGCSLGDPAIGVLVVEIDNSHHESLETMSYFKAIRNLLCDCLNI